MRNFTQEYKYDQIGNLLQMKSNGVWTRDYMYNFATNNHLLKHDENATINSYEYDQHGNTTKMPHLPEMKYDYADQLNEVTLNASGNKAYYIYNAEGERVRKVIEKGNIKEERFYIGDYELYTKKTNGTLDTERETLHIQDDKSKVALIDNDGTTTTIRYQLTNHLDSASLELDETGDIISYEEYHPFGTTSYRSGRNEIDVSLKRYKYVHKELDNETGLYYYGMRYYAPWIARFISVDPLQFKYPIYTPYQYAGNKPISFIDLDGAEEAETNFPNQPQNVLTDYWKNAFGFSGGVSGQQQSNKNTSDSFDSFKSLNNLLGFANPKDTKYLNIAIRNTSEMLYSSQFASSFYMNSTLKAESGSDWQMININLYDAEQKNIKLYSEGLEQLLYEGYTTHIYNRNIANYNDTYSQILEESAMILDSGMYGTLAVETVGALPTIYSGLRQAGTYIGKSFGFVNKSVTSADGFLFKGFTVNAPFNIPVQRIGNMSITRPDFWGLRIGLSKFSNRTFAAIKPLWNPLTQYTKGVIPKGTPMKFGIVGPQGLKYPGGSFQFITNSNKVINQSSKLIK